MTKMQLIAAIVVAAWLGDAHASVLVTSFGPATSLVYEGDLVTIQMTVSSSIGDFTGGSAALNPDGIGGETMPDPAIASFGLSGSRNSGSTSVRFRDNGTANLVVNGVGSESYQQLVSYGSYWVSTGWSGGYYVYYPIYETRNQSNSFTAATSFQVLNRVPEITSLTSDLETTLGTAFEFAASALDAGVFDVLSFEWDFDGDGQYDDFSGASGLWSTLAVGIHNIGLRVSDGDGGFDFGAFEVSVVAPPVSEPNATTTPEPAAILQWASLTGMVATVGWRRLRAAHDAAV